MINLRALELAREIRATASGITKLAEQVGEQDARWAVQQWELRRRARAKFANADELLFTREALEQATHEQVAKYHASLFVDRLGSDAVVADLTTGIGSDLIAFARHFTAVGFDIDPERMEYARHNLQDRADLVLGDSLKAEWAFDAAFADPARRVDGRRTLLIDEFSPDPRELSRRMSDLELGIMKLSPMLSDEELARLGPEIVFTSFAGECREALVLTGARAKSGVWAVQIENELLAEGGSPVAYGGVDVPADWLYEADPALIRAHGVLNVAFELNLDLLGDSNGYLTSNDRVASPWLKRYPVLYSGKGDWSVTKQVLRRLEAAKPVLKQRGAKQDLIQLAKKLKPFGDRQVAVVLWTVGKSIRHTIVGIK